MPAEYRARIEAGQPRLEQMAHDVYGITIRRGPFGINSRLALIADKYAEQQGKGAAFHHAVFKAYWEEAQSIDDVKVLAGIGERVGLDRGGLLAAIRDPSYIGQVDSDIALAHEYQMSSVPSLVFAEKYLVVGAQPLHVLEQVLAQVQAEQAAE